ncbi:hypothetical protein D9M68_659560 [compost metagenome]
MPAFQVERAFVPEPRRLALLDDQRTDQTATQLLATGGVRVIPEATGIRGLEPVVEVFARQHRQLRDIGHAIHLQRQADTVPMDGGRHLQPVDETHPQPLALPGANLQARRLATIGPGRGDMPRHQFEVQRCGDQFVVILAGNQRTAQPIAHAAGAKAEHTEASQTGKNLSAGKGH